MKRIYHILYTAIALVAFQSTLLAQPGVTIDKTTGNPSNYTLNDKGIGYSKAITGPNDDGVYTIHLHTFVAGNGEIIHNDLPADVVLVLDVSGSMKDRLETVESYTELSSTSYSYNSVDNNSNYWYLYEGQYYRVRHRATDVTGEFMNHDYYFYLYFTDSSGVDHYLSGSGDQTDVPSNAPHEHVTISIGYTPRNSTTIFTGVLYSQNVVSQTKIEALRTSVCAFIDLILANDKDRQGNPLDNTISIVKFANDEYYPGETATSTDATGNHKMGNGNFHSSDRWNYTEIVAGFTPVKDGGAQALKDIVNGENGEQGLWPGGATAADYGMAKAEALIGTLYKADGTPKRQSNKTIVFFTDGEPNHESGFIRSVANSAIGSAKNIKSKVAYTDNGKKINVSVYSVGVFDKMTDDIEEYMNFISSNYPTAEDMDTDHSDGEWGGGYYKDASDGNLEEIFRSIASEAGGNQSLSGSSITAIDVVSQSFDIPDNAGTITFYEVPVKEVYKNEAGRDTIIFKSRTESPGWILNPAGVSVEPDEDNPHKITATGFEYAKKYCGILSEDGVDKPHGSKLVLEIQIKMAEDAVGGPGVETNGPGSGIFLDGSTTPELEFESPTVNLPVNLQIQKVGLQNGESAKFKIQRIPETSDPSTAAETDWEDVTTVFVTEDGSSTDNPEVYIRGLAPAYHYRILEEEWGWSYDFVSAEADGYIINDEGQKEFGTVTVEDRTKVTSDKFVGNPIIFTNSPKAEIESKVHHAEGKATNTFNGTNPVYVHSKPQ